MTYIKVTWNEKWRVYKREEISQEKAAEILRGYFRDISFIGKYQFRLRIPGGWIQTETEKGLVPQPGFFGVCGDWEPQI